MTDYEPVQPEWIEFFSSTTLLGFAVISSIVIIICLLGILSRACLDWYLMVFTTMAVFELLLLFPFIQSSRLAPGEIESWFHDVDRPWMVIVVYSFGVFSLLAATTSFAYLLIFIHPRWADRPWMTSLRLSTTLLSFLLPSLDAYAEWNRQDLSAHCVNGLCRWYILRKDASLCAFLLLWSTCVLITIISANLRDILLTFPSLISYRIRRVGEPNIPVRTMTSESEFNYRREIMLEKARAERMRMAEVEAFPMLEQIPVQPTEKDTVLRRGSRGRRVSSEGVRKGKTGGRRLSEGAGKGKGGEALSATSSLSPGEVGGPSVKDSCRQTNSSSA